MWILDIGFIHYTFIFFVLCSFGALEGFTERDVGIGSDEPDQICIQEAKVGKGAPQMGSTQEHEGLRFGSGNMT